MNDNLEQLLWQRKDGELAADDRAQLDSLLAEGASEEEREIESIARLLSRARFEEEEVPAELRARVLAQVQARTASRRSSHGVVKSNRNALATGLSTLIDAFKKESLMSRKRLALLGSVGAVVVAGVTFLVLSDDFPPTGRVTGAIGGVEKADRYRDTQVKAEDVKIYDADGFDQDGYDRDGLDRSGNRRVDDKAAQGHGSIANSQGNGAFSPLKTAQGNGSIANAQGNGKANDLESQGHGSIANAQGNGKVNSQGHGSIANAQGNGKANDLESQGHGSIANVQGNGKIANSQGNGSIANAQGNGKVNSQGHGSIANSQGHGSIANSQGGGTAQSAKP